MAAVRPLRLTMREPVRLIALDLDGTLLNSRKELPPEEYSALAEAAAAGIEIVPTTGRFFGGMPQAVRDLPFLHYAITVNGAQVYDIRQDRAIARAEIPWQRAVEIMSWLDELPVIYDCFMDNWGWMSRSMWEKAADFAPDEHYLKMIRELRRPVDELKAFLTERKHDVQKVQFFCRDMALRQRLLREMPQQLPDIAVSSAISNNVELNCRDAHKGAALHALADYLGLPMEAIMAFGDGSNDVSMLRAAGIGVAMGNACDEARSAADQVTADCDHHGVAQGIRRFCL